jgi:hypothetical protein
MTLPKAKSITKLTQKAVKGVFWSYLSFLGGRGLGFLSIIILARLLLPEQFGLSWRQVWYTLPMSLVYPFERTHGEFGSLAHSLAGEQIYQTAKRTVRSRIQPRGPQ